MSGRFRHVVGYLRDFLFREEQTRQPVKALSGGERNRLLLAKILAEPRNLLVLDEPTNDLDMDTLDLLEDLLADYEGTLLLVSHDRDFIDRLATSTIALDGRGGVVETPGGWVDFLEQNPGFFDLPSGRTGKGGETAREGKVRAQAPASKPAVGKQKLSYKDQRRLEELDALMPRLAGQIAAHERTLEDAGLYARDPAGFDRIMAALTAARAQLSAAEEEWLALEEKREAVEAGG